MGVARGRDLREREWEARSTSEGLKAWCSIVGGGEARPGRMEDRHTIMDEYIELFIHWGVYEVIDSLVVDFKCDNLAYRSNRVILQRLNRA